MKRIVIIIAALLLGISLTVVTRHAESLYPLGEPVEGASNIQFIGWPIATGCKNTQEVQPTEDGGTIFLLIPCRYVLLGGANLILNGLFLSLASFGLILSLDAVATAMMRHKKPREE